MGKITQALLGSWKRLSSRLGEREAAAALGCSQSGFRAAAQREHAPPRKDRRGKKKKIPKGLGKRMRQFRDKVNRQGGEPKAKYVIRKMKIRGVCLRTVQRELTSDGAVYRPRKTGKAMTDAEMQARVQHCLRRLQEKFVYKGPRSARGAARGIDVWVDCHSKDMPLEKAPCRSRCTCCTFLF